MEEKQQGDNHVQNTQAALESISVSKIHEIGNHESPLETPQPHSEEASSPVQTQYIEENSKATEQIRSCTDQNKQTKQSYFDWKTELEKAKLRAQQYEQSHQQHIQAQKNQLHKEVKKARQKLEQLS